jgi:hypothetical protein
MGSAKRLAVFQINECVLMGWVSGAVKKQLRSQNMEVFGSFIEPPSPNQTQEFSKECPGREAEF